jgi:hypothetical protein
MWPSLQRRVWLLGVLVTIASCGGGSTGETTADTSTTTFTSTSTSTTTTSTTTTTLPPTTLPPTTTTTTLPPTPAEQRAEFIGFLEAEGWVEYVEPEKGWSIRYPADWEVVLEDPDDRNLTFGLAAADGAGLMLVSIGLDAQDDSGSFDYLEKSIEYAVDEGTLNPPGDSDWFWLDHDFDGIQGLLDVAGVQATLVADPLTGDTIPEGAMAPTWWFGYYNPDVHPDYGYIFQTIGADPALFNVVDEVVLSFSPPEQ